MDFNKIAVLGAGRMGSQIALQCAVSGFEVSCYSNDAASLKEAEAFAKDWFSKRVGKGKMAETDAVKFQQALTYTGDIKTAVSGAEFIVEAVPDILEVKRQVLAEADKYAPEQAVYGSNSSYLGSSLFCDAVRHPENVINTHFFNPALVMKLVEVVESPHCSRETIEKAVGFVQAIGKTPARVKKEVYGFLVNRIFSAITKEACYLYDQGIASIEDIDMAVKLGLSHPMGPLELLDMTGIDLEYHILMQKFQLTGDPADKPSPALVERYAKGEYGRRTGKGFYDYSK